MPTIAYQLYCSRNFPPVEDTLAMLARTGFSNVEGYGGLYDDVEGLRRGLDANGLSMPSGHFALGMIENEPDRTIEVARRLGVQKVFVPFVNREDRPTDGRGWAGFATRLAEAGKPIRDAGLAYGWHNHDFELQDLGGLDTPLDLIAQAGLDLELDLAWVARAGQDPARWLHKLGGQVTAAHVKDIAPPGEAQDEDGWADVGHGVMDWAAIRAELAAHGIDHWVIEHDNPSDHARFARRSLETVQGW
jgi:sugar phosphate isomerase/epimerase